MDRDRRWERVSRAYEAIAEANGPRFADAAAVVADAYARDLTDEFVPPGVVGGYQGMRDGDGILCFNFRADRVRELLTALVDPDFAGFPRPRLIRLAGAAGLTRYSDELDPYLLTIFSPQPLLNVLGQVVADAGRTQLRMAETEKYAHVTYFINGRRETPFPGEDRDLVPSPKVPTYDLQPEMSAAGVTNTAVEHIRSGEYDFVVMNYANADMVGHTGVLDAAIKAVEAVDTGVGKVVEATLAVGGGLLITADHGNAEQLVEYDTGKPFTAHTTNPVPLYLIAPKLAQARLRTDGILADVAPTILQVLGIQQPKDMSGKSLLLP
jgi:2,3-bisphosphoglycerate-independent phosphoglycerate mutase